MGKLCSSSERELGKTPCARVKVRKSRVGIEEDGRGRGVGRGEGESSD